MTARVLALFGLVAGASAQAACTCSSFNNYSPTATYPIMCINTANVCVPQHGTLCDSGTTACVFAGFTTTPATSVVSSGSSPPPPIGLCVDRANKAAKCAKASQRKCAKVKFNQKCCASCVAFPQSTNTCSDIRLTTKCVAKINKCHKRKMQTKCRRTCNVGNCVGLATTGR